LGRISLTNCIADGVHCACPEFTSGFTPDICSLFLVFENATLAFSNAMDGSSGFIELTKENSVRFGCGIYAKFYTGRSPAFLVGNFS
jgi:hypothetical protein